MAHLSALQMAEQVVLAEWAATVEAWAEKCSWLAQDDSASWALLMKTNYVADDSHHKATQA